MKLTMKRMGTTLGLVCAASITLSCSRESRPPRASRPSTAPTQTALATAPVAEAATTTAEPNAPGIPRAPAVAPPVAPRAQAPEDAPLTLSSGAGAARPVTAGLVPSDPALDKAESAEDRESVSELRALLAADTSLSPTARNVTIVARQGRIWLRGQVNTAAERAAIERSARKAAHVRDVRNELVVLE